MASSNSKGQLVGSIGPIYYRMLNGKTIAQTKPGKKRVKQSDGTKTSASEFGSASATARLLRLGLLAVHRSLTDGQMVNRLNKRIYEATIANTSLPKGSRTLLTGNLDMLAGFNFNMASPFEKICSVAPDIEIHGDGSIRLSTDAFSATEMMIFPQGAFDAELCMLVCTFDPSDWSRSFAEVCRIPVPGRNAAVGAYNWVLPILPEGHLAIVVSNVIYFGHDRLMGRLSLNSREMNPCVLTAAFRCGA